ncbi:MAG: Na+/H+ antiporter NhaA, partial [Planctomycetota bacterium]
RTMSKSSKRPLRFLYDNSLFLIGGAIAALVWANIDSEGYRHFTEAEIIGADPAPAWWSGTLESTELSSTLAHTRVSTEGNTLHVTVDNKPHYDLLSAKRAELIAALVTKPPSDGTRIADIQFHKRHRLSLHFLVNDLLMALFFAIAAKEVWEALLPGGALSDPRKAATPLLATVGGMVGPAGLFLLGVSLFGPEDLSNGWAVPMATDIAFSYLVARFVFGARHPAIPFLLLLAIADDAGGLLVLAIFFPQDAVRPEWLLLTAGAVLLGFAMRRMKLKSFWWYLLGPGVISWFSFFEAHLHPALGLVPIIPTMPHAHTDLGMFVRRELGREDTLNAFEHWWKNPVELILGLFGLVNAGVVLSSVGNGTYLVLAGLAIGKPLGITLLAWLGAKLFKLQVPDGVDFRDVFIVGVIAGLGFTVALFMSTAAFPAGKYPAELLDSVKMGALASFAIGPIAILIAKMMGVKRVADDPPSHGDT